MDRDTLQNLFDAMKSAEAVASEKYGQKDVSLDGSIAYQRAWKAYDQAILAYHAALNEYVAAARSAWNTRAQSTDLLRERDELREQLAIAQKTVLAYQNHTGQTLDDTLGGKWTNSVPKLQADNARLREALEKIDHIEHAMPRDDHGAGPYYQGRLSIAQDIASAALAASEVTG